jgi:HTH-type transcriptional regulator / antitoxin HigA
MPAPINENTINPGERIRNLLVLRNWNQHDLALVTGLSRQTITSIIAGRSGITPESAMALASAFGNEATEWLLWDTQFRLLSVRIKSEEIQRRAKTLELAPVREMQRRGWIDSSEGFSALELQLKKFFRVEDLHNIEGQEALFLRAVTNNPTENSKALRAWVGRANQLARAVTVQPFSHRNLGEAEKELHRISAFSKEIYRVPDVFARYGIRFVIIEPLPFSKVDGAAFWLDEASPVIALSLRYDRIDSFWFTLFHEFMHIKNKDEVSIDENMEEQVKTGSSTELINDVEARASKQAAESLINPVEIDSFIRRVGPLYSEAKIIQFAHRIKVHPGIIVGQLQRSGRLSYSSLRQLLVKVRGSIIETALTDGWGKVVPEMGWS